LSSEEKKRSPEGKRAVRNLGKPTTEFIYISSIDQPIWFGKKTRTLQLNGEKDPKRTGYEKRSIRGIRKETICFSRKRKKETRMKTRGRRRRRDGRAKRKNELISATD